MNRFSSAVFAIILLATTVPLHAKWEPAVDVPLSFLEDQLTRGNVKRVDVEHDQLSGELTVPQTWEGQSVQVFRTMLPEGTTSQWNFMQWLLANRRDAVVNVRNQSNLVLNIIVPLIPWMLIFGFIWFFVFRQLRSQQKAAYTGDALRVFVANPPPGNGGQPPMPPPPLSR